ncbi:hypothetical protein [Roseibium sp.]|uniref:hypothetical protein n=1 Tax=Roseibium sp. TaxID=1936156 RepID=UPI003B504B93
MNHPKTRSAPTGGVETLRKKYTMSIRQNTGDTQPRQASDTILGSYTFSSLFRCVVSIAPGGDTHVQMTLDTPEELRGPDGGLRTAAKAMETDFHVLECIAMVSMVSLPVECNNGAAWQGAHHLLTEKFSELRGDADPPVYPRARFGHLVERLQYEIHVMPPEIADVREAQGGGRFTGVSDDEVRAHILEMMRQSSKGRYPLTDDGRNYGKDPELFRLRIETLCDQIEIKREPQARLDFLLGDWRLGEIIM